MQTLAPPKQLSQLQRIQQVSRLCCLGLQRASPERAWGGQRGLFISLPLQGAKTALRAAVSRAAPADLNQV